MNTSEEGTQNYFHVPVLVHEVLEGLRVETGIWYIDATAGGGGHTGKILAMGGRVLAIEQDTNAIEVITKKFEREIAKDQLRIQQGNFRDIQKLTKKAQLTKVKGILFDLGMSTYHIKQSGRGFSFLKDEPLDMRMSQQNKVTAAEIINTYPQESLTTLFIKFGEERFAADISEAVVAERKTKEITRAIELAQLIKQVYSRRGIREKIHPATRVFQALRIAVNEELAALKEALPQTLQLLESSGRLAVISFHSLEDRIVKQFLLAEVGKGNITIITKRPIVAGEAETQENPAARSAKLRIANKN